MASEHCYLLARPHQVEYKNQFKAAFSGAVVMFTFGLAVGFTSAVGPQLTDRKDPSGGGVYLSAEQMSWFTSCIGISALLGSLIGARLMNKIGRRCAVGWAALPFFVGFFMMASLSWNFASLMVGRNLTGLGCGMAILLVPVFVSEVASPEIRGTLVTITQVGVSSGIFVSNLLGATLLSWRSLSAVSMIPSVVFLVQFCKLKDSPRFCLAKRIVGEATDALSYYRGRTYNAAAEIKQIIEAREAVGELTVNKEDIVNSNFIKPLLIVVLLMFFQQFTGITPVIFNLDSIFKNCEAGLSSKLSGIIFAAIHIPGMAAGMLMIDRFGRRCLLMVSSLIVVVALYALGLYFYEKSVDSAWTEERLWWLPLTSLVTYIVGFSIGMGPVPWALMGEFFTCKMRSVASCMITVSFLLFSFTVAIVFRGLVEYIHDYGVYWLFGSLSFISFVFVLFALPETSGKSLEEIIQIFDRRFIERDQMRPNYSASGSYDSPEC